MKNRDNNLRKMGFWVFAVTLDKEEVVGMRWVMVGSWRSSCDAGPPRGILQDEDE